ncbi:LacI family DNA-binding transcriptional regulator [Lapidilactobacillus mulanensis]|uniref:LacI family DNA-binding transcriptional regulator n=1 Tax=Lapidilactobacillus mulanensis TaxID=2485999 RepID=A0ABW4DMD7_9LACO|nr:LacI family DNA-binding transcriptional regulator [Lapidilactobacillus mulanensis]
MAKVTIRDVAREAGVSIATVSKALNNVDVVKPSTKRKIIDAVKKLDYSPNLIGKQLKSGSTRTVGLFTSSVRGPYYSILIDGLANFSEKEGYGLNVFISSDREKIMNTLRGRLVDGALLFDPVISQEEIALLNAEQIPSVFLDRKISQMNTTSIVFDSFQAGYEIGNYLINMGHQRIAFIAGYAGVYDSEQRLLGLKQALFEHGLSFPDEYRLEGMFEREASYNAILSFIRLSQMQQFAFPTAFVAGNDLSATGAIKAFKHEGLRVPEDVSVVGFDDIDVAEYFNPPLTTIKNPIMSQARGAIEMLMELMDGKKDIPSCALPGELIIRKSATSI